MTEGYLIHQQCRTFSGQNQLVAVFIDSEVAGMRERAISSGVFSNRLRLKSVAFRTGCERGAGVF
jgi:hypothetical protein